VLYKVEGAGNDFVLGVGGWAERLRDHTTLVERLCDRRRGIGADGVLALFAGGGDRLQLLYRNRDGSRAAFCANATRCAARVAVAALGAPPRLRVATDWCELVAVVDGDSVALELPPPPAAPRQLSLRALGQTWQARLLEVGVPHLVVSSPELATLDVEGVGRALRDHPELAPAGANVSFVAATGEDRLEVRSFERGVEAETLCCGSGVVAAALIAMGDEPTRLECVPRSGDPLLVEALGTPPVCASRLTGGARIVATVELSQEWLAESAECGQPVDA
jgi:diaminopimelate epimerase